MDRVGSDRDALRERLAAASVGRSTGRVIAVRGVVVRVTLPGVRLGDRITIRRRGAPLPAEVVGFEGGEAVAVAFGDLEGVGPDDPVEGGGRRQEVGFGDHLIGRVLDARGEPLDDLPSTPPRRFVPLRRPPPAPLARAPIDEPLPTGIRAIDGLLTLGRGQRLGLFAGSGVGKSELLGQLARHAAADVVVVALVGERGREVVDFLEHGLGPSGRARSVVVVATSDAPPLERLRAAETATALAEGFRDEGKDVLLLVDSVTRVARAQREVGLASGEPPGRRGYPPSVFALLPRLLERAGRTHDGALSAVYAVLTEGDDPDEPITDEVRGLLDGHIVLSRRLAERGHFPAIDVAASLSRLFPRLASREQLAAAARVRRWWAAREEKRDLLALGAYQAGSDTAVDGALARWATLERFLRQERSEVSPWQGTVDALIRLAE
jgi:FliI/YscN family ATPase